ncbi:MAG TPA: N-acetylmuramoyl-L-alanine amidase-like domain-containing protein [Pseudolabrys sp.]|nr:N-acetylmuramoyl-L-alanine amidase-like domain-containing protein [Pseudolabrys sp.]
MSLTRRINRRAVLAGVAASAVQVVMPRGFAAETRIPALIAQTRGDATISQRIDRISHALIGTRYLGYTLIGGPKKPEQFVMRDDGFDCVTFCETVLAAAMAQNMAEFETSLRRIRYRDGVVEWRARNHYFYEWRINNVDNGVCRPVAMDDPMFIEKSLDTPPELGKRHIVFPAIPRATLLANKDLLLPGDIVGIVSMRSWLDYYHTGFIAFGDKGELMLRHASKTYGRVINEPMQQFVSENHVRCVTLLRPRDIAPPAHV